MPGQGPEDHRRPMRFLTVLLWLGALGAVASAVDSFVFAPTLRGYKDAAIAAGVVAAAGFVTWRIKKG